MSKQQTIENPNAIAADFFLRKEQLPDIDFVGFRDSNERGYYPMPRPWEVNLVTNFLKLCAPGSGVNSHTIATTISFMMAAPTLYNSGAVLQAAIKLGLPVKRIGNTADGLIGVDPKSVDHVADAIHGFIVASENRIDGRVGRVAGECCGPQRLV
jgi:hypothetical protein